MSVSTAHATGLAAENERRHVARRFECVLWAGVIPAAAGPAGPGRSQRAQIVRVFSLGGIKDQRPRERLQYFAGRIARTAYLEAGVVPWADIGPHSSDDRYQPGALREAWN